MCGEFGNHWVEYIRGPIDLMDIHQTQRLAYVDLKKANNMWTYHLTYYFETINALAYMTCAPGIVLHKIAYEVF